MAAGPWVVTYKAKELLGKKGIDFSADSYFVVLASSSSNISTASEAYASLTGELSTANGYTAGGYAVTPAWTGAGGTYSFDTSNATWTASGGSIVARYAILVNDSTTSPVADLIMAYCLLDAAPADVTATAGKVLTVAVANILQMT